MNHFLKLLLFWGRIFSSTVETLVFAKLKINIEIGLTETCTLVSSSSPTDQWLGSSGCLLPGIEGRLITREGEEIQGYDSSGELLIRSKSNALGYFNSPQATKETFVDGWVKTGDEALFRKAPTGSDHIFIVDRIKELIKVNVSLNSN